MARSILGKEIVLVLLCLKVSLEIRLLFLKD